jgi:hypothetical protein
MAIASHPSFDGPGDTCTKCRLPRLAVMRATPDDIGRVGFACPPNTKLTQTEYDTIEDWRVAVNAITAEVCGAGKRWA